MDALLALQKLVAEGKLPLGTGLIVFAGLLEQFSGQVNNVATIVNSVQQSLIGARRVFESVLQQDPGCAIAYWGIAMDLLGNSLGAPPSRENANAAWVALEKARELGRVPSALTTLPFSVQLMKV